jgi:hypothetical protein
MTMVEGDIALGTIDGVSRGSGQIEGGSSGVPSQSSFPLS